MLRKFRSLFIVEEETQANTSSKSESAESAAGSPSPPPSGEADPASTLEVRDGQVNEKFLNVLLEAMEKSNLQGFDYMEFKQFLKSLEKVKMDEATKFRSAFATGQTMGATKENLLSSADRYLDILRKEEERFQQAVKSQRSKILDDKQSGIAMLERTIKEKQAQIERLSAEIESSKKKIQQGKEDVALATAKVQQTQSDFNYTYKLLIVQLQEDIQKIKTYLS